MGVSKFFQNMFAKKEPDNKDIKRSDKTAPSKPKIKTAKKTKSGTITMESLMSGGIQDMIDKYVDNDHLNLDTDKKDDEVKEDGPFENFFDNGVIKNRGTRKNGIIEGKYELFYKSGALMDVLNYHDGESDGRQIAYFENGKIQSIENYKKGKRHGQHITYFPNGNIEYQCEYLNGKHHGISKTYFESGQMWFYDSYYLDVRHGKSETYYKNGQLKGVTNDNMGKTHGIVQSFDENGKLTLDREFENGKLTKNGPTLSREEVAQIKRKAYNKKKLASPPKKKNITLITSKAPKISTSAKTAVVFDFETTGLSPNVGDRTIEIGAAIVENGEIIETFQELMNPGIQINSFIENYTGITNAMLSKARNCESVMDDFFHFISGYNLVAHNASFDNRFLVAELERINKQYIGNICCSMMVSRRIYQDAPNYKLHSLVDYKNIEQTGDFHRALADAEMTARLWSKMIEDIENKHNIVSFSFENAVALTKKDKRYLTNFFKELS